MALGEKVLLTLSRPAAAAVATSRLLGYIDSNGKFALSGAGGRADGVNTSTCTAADDLIDVETGDYILAAAGGTIAIGDEVGANSASKAVVWVSGKKIGRAESTGASGGTVLIRKYAEKSQNDTEFELLSADGAVTIPNTNKTFIVTKATAAALTLADPTAGTHDGVKLTFISATAAAHTLSNSAGSGFNAGGAGADVGTFGGAKGDGITVIAYNGDWYVIDKTNVTLA